MKNLLGLWIEGDKTLIVKRGENVQGLNRRKARGLRRELGQD